VDFLRIHFIFLQCFHDYSLSLSICIGFLSCFSAYLIEEVDRSSLSSYYCDIFFVDFYLVFPNIIPSGMLDVG